MPIHRKTPERRSGKSRQRGARRVFRAALRETPPDVPERIRRIQRLLGVRPDGWVGPETLSRLEAVLAPLGLATSDTLLTVSRKSLDALVAFEISSPEHYKRALTRPTWPGGESGITIGVGYDLGTVTASRFVADWQSLLPDADVAALRDVVGLQGASARAALPGVRSISVPLEMAERVFHSRTLISFATATCRIYPGMERLPPDASGALVSLVYNRGTRLEGASRREMKEIRALVTAQDLGGIAARLRAMKRLWDPHALPGLIKRREAEAELVEHARRAYLPEELVRI